MAFASGKHSIADCDICDQQYKLLDLLDEVVNGKKTGFKVCRTCLDQDQPQWLLAKVRVNDPQAVRDPRPDRGVVGNLSPADRLNIQEFFDAYTTGIPS